MVFEARLESIAATIRAAEFRLRSHAAMRMDERGIALTDALAALLAGEAEIIENYSSDERGASCLVLSSIRGRPLHLLISFPPNPVLITVYWPDEQPEEWDATFRRRVR